MPIYLALSKKHTNFLRLSTWITKSPHNKEKVIMHSDWTSDEIIEHLTLLPSDREFLGRNAPPYGGNTQYIRKFTSLERYTIEIR